MLIYINSSNFIDGNFYLFGKTEDEKDVYLCIYKHETYLLCKSLLDSKSNKRMKSYEMQNIKSILEDNQIELVEDKKITYELMMESQAYKHDLSVIYKCPLKDYNQFSDAIKLLNDKKYFVPEFPSATNKFFSDLGLYPSQWIEIDVPKEKGTSTNEGVIWDDFVETDSLDKPYQFLLKSSSIKNPELVKLPPPMKILTMDCEMMSSRFGINGSRAHPNSVIEGDVIYCISLVMGNSQTKEVTDRKCLFITDQNLEISTGEIIKCSDEEDLLLKFSEYIRKENPDLITCYNGQGFDFPYIEIRSSLLSIPIYGRLKSFSYKKFDLNLKLKLSSDQRYKTDSFDGAGRTYHKYTSPIAHGRIIADTFNLVKGTKVSKGVQGKLQSLKLSDVGEYFIKETKEDISYSETYLGFRSKVKTELERISSYCVQDSVLTWKIFMKMNAVVYLREASRMFFMDMGSVLDSGQTAKIYDNMLIKGFKDNFVFYLTSNKRSFKVRGGFVEEPLRGKRTNVLCVDFSSMYPTTQMARNLCSSTFSALKPTNLSPDQYDEYSLEVEVEAEKLPIYYDDYIDEFDINEINNKEYIKKFLDDWGIIKEHENSFLNLIRKSNSLEEKVNTQILKVYFVKKEVREGIFPKMLSSLREDRIKYKRMMKEANKNGDDASYEIYNQRQSLIKVVMNSVYGVLGSSRSPLTCLEVPSTITHFGRESIIKVRDYFIRDGCRAIYGDTDSIMVQIPNYKEYEIINEEVSIDEIIIDNETPENKISKDINGFNNETPESKKPEDKSDNKILKDGQLITGKLKDGTKINGILNNGKVLFERKIYRSFEEPADEEAIKYGYTAVEKINASLPKPMEIEFEKIMHMVVVKKKHYFGCEVYKDGHKTNHIFVKGLAGIRGDSTPFAQNIFSKVVSDIIKNKTQHDIDQFTREKMKDLHEGKIPVDMLTVFTMLAHGYKSDSAPMNVYARYLKEIGTNAEAGTKIPYVVIKGEKGKPKSYSFRPPETNEELDYDHYEKRAIKPIKEILEATYVDIDEENKKKVKD